MTTRRQWTLIAFGLAFLLGCQTAPPHRVTLEELIQQSVDASGRAREIAVISAEQRETMVASPESPISLQEPGSPERIALPMPLGVDAGFENFVTVSEEFIETDVREALTMLAEQGDFDLVMDEKVQGVVNTVIEDLTLDKAIEKLLMPLGFAHAWRGKQVVVAPADPTSPLFRFVAETTEFRPRHVETKTLMATIPTSMVPFTRAVEGTNLILIEAPKAIREQLIHRFELIDQPVPQVVLEAIICVVSPDSGFQLGLDWQHAVELNGDTALKLGSSGLALNGTVSRNGIDAVFSDFATTSAFVKLLCEHGYLTIRASPHVMAKDGEKAHIAINRETFFSITPSNSSNNSNNSAFFFQQNIQKVESGISLEITPKIRGDIVNIQIEKAEVSEDVRQANSEASLNPYPIINRRSVSTTVHVKDGKTIVIGGLVQRETVDRVNRVPGLSKIPLLGYLFESKQRQMREADVVIFISPSIVKPHPMEFAVAPAVD